MKRIIHKKYFASAHKQCRDPPVETRKGSPIWRLPKTTISLIHSYLYLVPSNGKNIDIISNNIMGKEALDCYQYILPLKYWIINQNFSRYFILGW
jgi:hypothetical protein